MLARSSLLVLCCAAVSTVALPSLAHATPSEGVTAQILFATTVPGTDLTLRRIEIAPGGTTGWHFHDGPVYAYVDSGVLSRTLDDCSTVDTAPGQLIAEDHGSDHVHEGSNPGTVPLVLYAFYTEPQGKPLSEDAAAAC